MTYSGIPWPVLRNLGLVPCIPCLQTDWDVRREAWRVSGQKVANTWAAREPGTRGLVTPQLQILHWLPSYWGQKPEPDQSLEDAAMCYSLTSGTPSTPATQAHWERSHLRAFALAVPPLPGTLFPQTSPWLPLSQSPCYKVTFIPSPPGPLVSTYPCSIFSP